MDRAAGITGRRAQPDLQRWRLRHARTPRPPPGRDQLDHDRMRRVIAWLLAESFTLVGAPVLHAGQDGSLAGPSPPVPPAVVSRDASGRATVRAVRITTPIRIDGALDEPLYSTVQAISDFIQQEPQEGEPATEKTELWVAFDEDNVYVAFRCWESEPDRVVANEMRRDGSNTWQGNDIVAVSFDTFLDRRNSFNFVMNALGARTDGHVTNERQWNGDWNTVWAVKSGRFEGGWTVEAAIPFKSLRYQPGRVQTWGFNAFRTNRWRNEISYVTRVPAARGQNGLYQGTVAATLVGVEAPSGSRALEIKPYAISDLTTDRASAVSNSLGGDVGLDVKYGVTPNLTADFTYNTDFAQVEADEQQINLTRFSLFFPEKREFFLENQGTFAFGGVALGGQNAGNVDAPTLFYSRRIGLNRGQPVPLAVGGRATGRVGKFTIGALNIQTGDEEATASPSTNFSVVRLKRDFLRASSIGLIATNRSIGQAGTGSNAAFGVDAAFSFFENVLFNTYWARTRTDGLSGDDTSYRAQFDYPADRYGIQVERLAIGDNFNPEVGFVRRDDMVRDWAQFRFSPRPRADRPISRRIRKFSYMGSFERIENGDGRLESREGLGEFALEFQNADRFAVTY